MKKPNIIRKRFIPFETIDITGDELIFRDQHLLITKWKPIKPRKDISSGISYTFLKDGIKISKFYDDNGVFAYWYCDIIDVGYVENTDTYILMDLLVDIKILPDNSVSILDIDELAEAIEKGLISTEQACLSLRRVDSLLKMIYGGNFPPAVCKNELF